MSKRSHPHAQPTTDNLAEAMERIEKVRRDRSTTLKLNGLNLTELPESVTRLTQLSELYVYNNLLTNLPESITQLTQLALLMLDINQLTE